MPCLSQSYRAPAVVICVGCSFAIVGCLPLAITLGLGIKTSATIIGVGFVGFGAMMMVPGMCWCLVVQHRICGKKWRQRKHRRRSSGHPPIHNNDEEAPALKSALLNNSQSLPTPEQ